MYQKNTMKLKKLKSNMNFLDGRIQEISDYISKQEESNQTVSPVTLSILELNKLVDNVLNGNIDWGISVQKPKRKNLDYAEIGSFDLVFCCAKDLYKKFKNQEDILINIPFAENSWDVSLSKLITLHLRKNGIVPKEKIFSDHSGFIKKLCERGRCVMCIPENPLENYDG